MTPQQFVQKWSQVLLNEIQMAQSHFWDVCQLAGHLPPVDADPKGEFFTFEAPVEKLGGSQGRADVWFKNHFIWEYKGAHADLDKAYQQLLLYRESLGNPPLLITSDTRQIVIHTNFNNTVKRVYVVDFDAMLDGRGVELLRRVFHDPESFHPEETQEAVTRASAEAFVRVARTLQAWARVEGRTEDPERLAHFLIRLLFALFAEDMGLLPDKVLTKLVEATRGQPETFRQGLRGLFAAMRDGQVFGYLAIRYFNGGLFNDDYLPELPGGIAHDLLEACNQDWRSLEPSIFGTLFERVIDEGKRAQLGAHYTSRDDIMLIVEPVLMQPLREEWQRVRARAQAQVTVTSEVTVTLNAFAAKIAAMRVLDPACGSGNFLYVALRQLLDLQKEVIVFAHRLGLEAIPLTVGPEQLYGIEINPYAHELAQVTVWIGYLQWRLENGFADFPDPILRPLQNIENKDAILGFDGGGHPVEPMWPAVDVIIGNPPFLGGSKLRRELGDEKTEYLFNLYGSQIPSLSDLVTYWFEKARKQLVIGKAKRVGLLATNSIRTGVNRNVLVRIKETGGIFMAWSDRPWVLDGAAVRVSMVGFDNDSEKDRQLDGKPVSQINADLTTSIDVTIAKVLKENNGLVYKGIMKGGPFDIEGTLAREMLKASNPSGKNNADVLKPRWGGQDVLIRPRDIWIVDFGVDMSEEGAAEYVLPFAYVKEYVKPERDQNRRESRKKYWWLFGETNPTLREALVPLSRCIVTPEVAKYRIFNWMDTNIVPDYKIHVIVREDDYFFGVLQSRVHEIWSLAQGSWMGKGNDPSYSSSRTFGTFPFPWPPGEEPRERQVTVTLKVTVTSVTSSAASPSNGWEQVAAIADAARQLDAFRNAWLFPPQAEIGITISASMLNKRTLTHLYNALTDYRGKVKGRHRDAGAWYRLVGGLIGLDEIETLDHLHTELDRAVLAAYGWPAHLSDEEILGRLLEENLRRA